MEERNDEIDLLELSRNMMVGFYHYVIRRYMLLGIFIAVGGIIGLGMYLKDKSRYENTIIGKSYIVNPTYIVGIINSLNDINKGDKEVLAQVLNIDISDAENLANIEADTLESKSTLQIKVNFKNDFNLSEFSKKMLAYIDSNEYVKNEIVLYKNRNEEMIKAYDEEINKLDSLQGKILAAKIDAGNNPQGNLLVLNDKINNFFHNDIIDLQTKKQSAIVALNRLNGFTIIDQKRGTKIKEVSLVGTIIKMMAIFFVIGFVISIALEFIRKVKQIEQSKKV